ncbi:multidrug ABC transporter ATP-binding protein [Nanobdella aerobiophila]|uniref:Multidrug ABC transporter ATP-binding protein n=1 Tax=Nanobdella aerobiophila TaxID=2586965 RepID=A0A915SCB3_9ARCH|nr:ABC transporter ATP-binding protein [Nanobdella aerobiophila]BBL45238.1 multidrug ABC transporter ATP-binding protein [Nanobdella aerobiophila]
MMIKVENISKSYENIKALDNISFEIDKKENVFLIGPNGAGKSTTIKILAGLLKPDSGNIYIKNIDLLKNPEGAKKYIGYLPEEPIPFINLSVKENLEYIGLLRSIDNLYNKIDYYLNFFDLDKYKNYRAINLSRGNKQKLSLSMVLILDTEILLLDEPLNYLDLETQYKTINLLKERNNLKIISTHIVSLAEKIANRIILINKGKIIFNDNIEKIKDNLEDNIIKLLR